MERKTLILDFLSDKKYPPVNIEEIMLMLDIPFDDREELMLILNELCDENLIIKTSKKKYASPEKLGYVRGVISLAKGGFGFVEREDEDLFIPAAALNGAIGGDLVMAELKGGKDKRQEGRVVRIIKRRTDSFVGTIRRNKNFSFVVPDDERIPFDIFISKKKTLNARNGHKVVVRITKWHEPTKRDSKPEGEVTEILGYPDEPRVAQISVMRSHGIREEFPPRVEEYCRSIDDTISQADIASRCDFRQDTVITIDGADSRDFDDAVSIDYDGKEYTLGVHIADVSHYVTEGSPLDKEAFLRGTSVYFPGSVVPMLPKKLSNGICSLNPNEDRLTLSVIIKINKKGEIIEHNICEGIIRSKERMTYDDVTAILEGDKELLKKYSHITGMLKNMEELAMLLRNRRFSEGSIDFDFPEVKVCVDDLGRVADVYKSYSTVSHKIIEEFMLCANRVVAEEFFWADIPFVYRVHEKPTGDKLKAFNEFMRSFGYKIPSNRDVHPGEFSKILEAVKGRREEAVVSKFMLRSLMKAKYSTECLGHFGLSFRYYCHFTSPIRRYPDLAIHRIIKEFIHSGIREKRIRYYKKFVSDSAVSSSEAELKAMEAEREVTDIKKAEYIKKYIGESFDASITSITGFGFYAELENGIEGLVRLSDLRDDYYIFDESTLSLLGDRGGRRFLVGDPVRVIVAGADITNGNIDFYLV